MRLRSAGLAGIALVYSLAGAVLPSALSQEKAAAKPDPAASDPTEQKAAPVKAVPKADSLKQLEDNLFKPLQDSLNPDHSLDRPLTRPPRAPSPTEDRKLRDALDRKKNWVFMTPEEMLTGPDQNPNDLF